MYYNLFAMNRLLSSLPNSLTKIPVKSFQDLGVSLLPNQRGKLRIIQLLKHAGLLRVLPAISAGHFTQQGHRIVAKISLSPRLFFDHQASPSARMAVQLQTLLAEYLTDSYQVLAQGVVVLLELLLL